MTTDPNPMKGGCMATTDHHRTRFRPGMRAARLELVGITPLLMHAPTLLDPFHPITRDLRVLTKKKASDRTADEEMQIQRLEWQAALYHDDEHGPFLHGVMVKAATKHGATRQKLGATVTRSLVVLEDRIALGYDGPRGADQLWDEGYRFTCAVKNSGLSGGRVSRTRPMFEDWTLSCTLAWDPQELDHDKVARAVDRAGWLGIGDYRPEFGTFQATLTPLGGSELPDGDQ